MYSSYAGVGGESEATPKSAKFILNMKIYLSERDFTHKLWTLLYFHSARLPPFFFSYSATFAGSRVLVVSHSRNSSPNYYNQFTSRYTSRAIPREISTWNFIPPNNSVVHVWFISLFGFLSTYRSSLSLLRLRLSFSHPRVLEKRFRKYKGMFLRTPTPVSCIHCRTMVDFNITHPRTQTRFNDRRRVFHLVLLVEEDPRGQSRPTTSREK